MRDLFMLAAWFAMVLAVMLPILLFHFRRRRPKPCKRCGGQGWYGVQHPAKPAGVTIAYGPCERCNADEHIPDPWPKPKWTITTLEKGRMPDKLWRVEDCADVDSGERR